MAQLTDQERAALAAERDDLLRKLAKRENQPGLSANVAAVKARLAAIGEALQT